MMRILGRKGHGVDLGRRELSATPEGRLPASRVGEWVGEGELEKLVEQEVEKQDERRRSKKVNNEEWYVD